jgi:magnesium chelatase family protein
MYLNTISYLYKTQFKTMQSSHFPVRLPPKTAHCVHPSPRGYYGDPLKPCTCSSSTVTRYQKRISGPMLDRIDIHITVPRVDYEKLSDKRTGESSKTVRERVEAARERQRFVEISGVSSNADMRPAEVRKFCDLDATSTSLMKTAMRQLELSARDYHRVLKLARTIADLAGCVKIGPTHLAEALQYRPRMNDG